MKKIRIIRLVKYFFVTTCQVLFLSGYEGLFLNMAHISSMHEVGFSLKENLGYGHLTLSGKLRPDSFMMS